MQPINRLEIYVQAMHRERDQSIYYSKFLTL